MLTPEKSIVFQPIDLNTSDEGLVINVNKKAIYQKGDKIAQIRLSEVLPIEFKFVDKLTDTERGGGGFGSTGK